MKKIVMICIFLLAAAATAASEPGTDGGRDAGEDKGKPSPAVEDDAQEKSARDPNWPRPFIPSDKIGADSVVAFPADI